MEELNISGCSGKLKLQTYLHSLKHLCVNKEQVDQWDFKLTPQLEAIEFHGWVFKDLAFLSKIPKLKSLVFRDCTIEADFLRLNRLEHVKFHEMELKKFLLKRSLRMTKKLSIAPLKIHLKEKCLLKT